jgi:hypothetical protein
MYSKTGVSFGTVFIFSPNLISPLRWLVILANSTGVRIVMFSIKRLRIGLPNVLF